MPENEGKINTAEAIVNLTAALSRLEGKLDGMVTHEKAQSLNTAMLDRLRSDLADLKKELCDQDTYNLSAIRREMDDIREDMLRESEIKANDAAQRKVSAALDQDTKSMQRARTILLLAGGGGLAGLTSALWNAFAGG